jgi:hypothetical protein
MDELQLKDALVEAQKPFADGRFNLCELEIAPGDSRYRLLGRVLDEKTLAATLGHLRRRLPAIVVGKSTTCKSCAGPNPACQQLRPI